MRLSKHNAREFWHYVFNTAILIPAWLVYMNLFAPLAGLQLPATIGAWFVSFIVVDKIAHKIFGLP